jgi:hypothetical protein
LRTLNEITKRKREKYRTTIDWQQSKIQKMQELPNHLFGGVKSKNDATYLAFLIRNGKIELSDLAISRQSRFNFTYDLKTGSYTGIGTVNYFRECEMYVFYVLLLLDSLSD